MHQDIPIFDHREKKDILPQVEDYVRTSKMNILVFAENQKVIEILKKNDDEKKLKEIFAYFEEVCINSDDYLNNVFSITTLEILGNEKNILETAKKYMGPVTIKLQREADLAIGRKI